MTVQRVREEERELRVPEGDELQLRARGHGLDDGGEVEEALVDEGLLAQHALPGVRGHGGALNLAGRERKHRCTKILSISDGAPMLSEHFGNALGFGAFRTVFEGGQSV